MTNSGSGTVSVIDTTSKAVTKSITVGTDVRGVAPQSGRRDLVRREQQRQEGLVFQQNEGVLSIVDAATGVTTKRFRSALRRKV